MYQKNNRRKSINQLTLSGLLAAMITLTTAYILHIPYGTNGGYIHFGDTLIYLSAALLPQPYALAAAAVGGGLADLLTAPVWAPATILIKILITLPFTSHGPRLLIRRNIVALCVAFLISAVGYYVAEWILFGSCAALISIIGSLIQSGGSSVAFLVLAAALDRIHIKNRIGGNLYGRHSVHLS